MANGRMSHPVCRNHSRRRFMPRAAVMCPVADSNYNCSSSLTLQQQQLSAVGSGNTCASGFWHHKRGIGWCGERHRLDCGRVDLRSGAPAGSETLAKLRAYVGHGSPDPYLRRARMLGAGLMTPPPGATEGLQRRGQRIAGAQSVVGPPTRLPESVAATPETICSSTCTRWLTPGSNMQYDLHVADHHQGRTSSCRDSRRGS
jgi:hypothetical protein